MPQRPFDPRILQLAMQATTDVEAVECMMLRPDDVPATALDHAGPNYPWGWCDIRITATYGGVYVDHTLTAQRWTSRRAFLQSEVYTKACLKVFRALMHALDKAAAARAALGPAPGEEDVEEEPEPTLTPAPAAP